MTGAALDSLLEITMTYSTYKCLPFDTKHGHVGGYEIRVLQADWMKNEFGVVDPISTVVFECFDRDSEMSVKIEVHWTRVFEFLKKRWPFCGSLCGVRLASGRLIYATSYSSAGWRDSESTPAGWRYETAPLICRDTYKVTTLQSRQALIEVVGVEEWLRSDRSEAATAKYLACPWERDNRKFREETDHA